MIKKYTNSLDIPFKQAPRRKYKRNINIFWGDVLFFLEKRNKHRQSLICSKSYEMNNYLAILGLCTFYIEHKSVKFKKINFSSRTNVKYFMQTQVLWFCKDTTKVCSPLILH